MLSNFEAFMALKTSSDLCIMTNDGSQGLDVLKQIDSRHKKVLFYPNGVDPVTLETSELEIVKARFYNDPSLVYFISVSRLDGHKRLDRGIKIVDQLVLAKRFGNAGELHHELTQLLAGWNDNL